MSDWRETTLGQACELYQPQTISSSDLVADGAYPVYGANGVIGKYDKFNHTEPQLLVTCRGATCGAINISQPYSWINGNAMVVKPRDESIELSYLAHLFRGGLDLSMVITGAAQPQITRQSLAPVRVRFPPLEEQRRIAAILDQAETLRTQRRQALAHLDTLTQSTFLDVLDSAGRDVKKLTVEDGMDAIIDYRGKTPEKTAQGVPLVTAKVVKNGELLEPDEFIAEDAYDDWMRRGFPEAGDVLFTTEAPLGEVAQLDGRKVALAQRLLVLRGKSGVLQNTFLRFALTSWEVRRQIETRATGSTVKGIRQKELRQVELPIPPYALQQTFATRIQAIEALKATHRTALAQLDALFASLQQRAFAGEL